VGPQPIQGAAMLQELVQQAPIEEELTLTVVRQGRRLEVKVRPRARPDPLGSIGAARPPGPGLVESRRHLDRDRLRSREPQSPRRPTRPGGAWPERHPPPEPAPAGRGEPASPPLEPPEPLPR